MFPRILDRVVEWVKAHKQLGLEFEECGTHTWVFVRTWRKVSFYRVAVGVIDRYYSVASSELVIPGQVLFAIGSGVSLVSISGGSNTLVERYKKYIGSGYMRLSNFRNQTAQTLPPKNSFHCVRDARSFSDWIQRYPSIATGCSQGSLCEGRFGQVIFLCLGWWMLLATSSGCGRLLSLTSRKLARRTAATVLWYGFLFLFQL